jgi:hypothetical protein
MDAPALQELSLTSWHYGSVAAIYPACRCSPRAAGLDEIRGSAPNQSIEHERSLVHTGFADPGLTCPAITSSIALANRWGETVSRAQRAVRAASACCILIIVFLLPLGSTAGTPSSSRPAVATGTARSAGQGRPLGPPRQRLDLARCEHGARLLRGRDTGAAGIAVTLPLRRQQAAGRCRRAPSLPRRYARSCWPAPPPRR